ncbi:DUF736 domain-containing protein [Gluconacetobacter entanii]|uniref:DUF736 domain-containing protein n=1 Tax=Gluconacetobacter entanii TaxID=108528 RepID=UPI001C9335FB|nr:DUF736 domain-containing protein [Gluconacetobacter entanii]MBY4640466.1 DUF736 domain-containing protein [Gluconacetobacter entanii]MCW4579527.1 DUF736 domain-containing protein [Gluconacetobacter entanii]MCW4582960.1 DUF736 domain-containing protein [Gluconacetobacter entanii]MCW4586351.1 DUF736 domain-containing protein [Gluconacetobacter entanii]
MAQIGLFTRTADGFSGRLRTLSLDAELTLVRIETPEGGNAPDYRIHLGDGNDGPEVGAGWTRTGERAGEYIVVLLDDPSLTQGVCATLFQSGRGGRVWQLVWSRPQKRQGGRE